MAPKSQVTRTTKFIVAIGTRSKEPTLQWRQDQTRIIGQEHTLLPKACSGSLWTQLNWALFSVIVVIYVFCVYHWQQKQIPNAHYIISKHATVWATNCQVSILFFFLEPLHPFSDPKTILNIVYWGIVKAPIYKYLFLWPGEYADYALCSNGFRSGSLKENGDHLR